MKLERRMGGRVAWDTHARTHAAWLPRTSRTCARACVYIYVCVCVNAWVTGTFVGTSIRQRDAFRNVPRRALTESWNFSAAPPELALPSRSRLCLYTAERDGACRREHQHPPDFFFKPRKRGKEGRKEGEREREREWRPTCTASEVSDLSGNSAFFCSRLTLWASAASAAGLIVSWRIR